MIEKNLKNEKLESLFDQAQTEIYELMRKDSYARFKESQPFKDFIAKYAKKR